MGQPSQMHGYVAAFVLRAWTTVFAVLGSAGARDLEPPPQGAYQPHSCIWAPKYNCEAPCLIFNRK